MMIIEIVCLARNIVTQHCARHTGFHHASCAQPALAEVPEGPPIQFRWRKVQYRVLRSEGPERIACEWWKDGRGAYSRDYFRIETQDGYRLWIFRHGLYERETASPNWYVHGLFG